MGTPSYIAKQLGDDSYLAIFCQAEGYLHSLGAILSKHYNTPEQVDALLSLGDIHSLGAKLNPDPAIPGEQKDVTVAYGRDCGEPGYEAAQMGVEDMLDGENFVEYLYIYTQDNRWKFLCCTTEEMILRDVEDTLQAEAAQESDPNDIYAWLKAELRQFLVPGEAIQDDAPTMQM